jgi:thiamine biosynthesis lipoprotein ApbE
MIVRGPASSAHAAAHAALVEIDRLSAILNTRDPTSEFSRLICARTAQRCSPEIGALLNHYQTWADCTGGVINCRLQSVLNVWRQAELDGALPSDDAIDRATLAASQPAWSRDANGSVTFNAQGAINVDALGKGFIVDRALEAAIQAAPDSSGILLDIGGDIAVSGDLWTVGIASPFAPADNAPPLMHVILKNQAIATSAGYERSFTINGQRFSHILDPRTGWAARAAASSTVIAPDAVSANALSLALCILGPREGASLINTFNAAALVVENDGAVHRIGNFVQFERASVPAPRAMADGTAGAWAADHQVSIALVLKEHSGRRAHRPYVAVWVEDANRKPVRTVAVWGSDSKYQRDLTRWVRSAPRDENVVKAVSRATRQPGKYTIVWDGVDDAGKPVPAGKYTVFVEINREHGDHTTTSVTIDCGGASTAHATGEASEEAEAIAVDYARKDAR